MSWLPDIGVTPYYEDESVIIFNGDCRELLPLLPKDGVGLVFTDPPYGIGKADWDCEFPLWWLDLVAQLAPLLAITPGTWNLMKLPQVIGDLHYKWTLAAHLSNGMTRGGFGFGNWIPCVVYKKLVSPLSPIIVQDWCSNFAAWCEANNIAKTQIDNICGTSDMAGWWMGRIPNRCAIPAIHQWNKIKNEFVLPEEFDALVYDDRDKYAPTGDCKDFVIGMEGKPDHPTPKPLGPVTWFIDSISDGTVLDPFLGSGTTARAAKNLGRKCIGIEIEEKYCEIAAKRMSQTVMKV